MAIDAIAQRTNRVSEFKSNVHRVQYYHRMAANNASTEHVRRRNVPVCLAGQETSVKTILTNANRIHASHKAHATYVFIRAFSTVMQSIKLSCINDVRIGDRCLFMREVLRPMI